MELWAANVSRKITRPEPAKEPQTSFFFPKSLLNFERRQCSLARNPMPCPNRGSRDPNPVLHGIPFLGHASRANTPEGVYSRVVPRLGHNQAIGTIAHHHGVRCEAPAVTRQSKPKRTARMIWQFQSLGSTAPNPQPGQVQAQ